VEDFLRLKGIDFPDFNPLALNLYHAERFFFYLALFFLLLRVGYEVRWKVWVEVLLLIFLATDLFGNMGFYGKEKTSDYFRKTKILEMISSDTGHFRMFTTEKTTSMDTVLSIDSTSPLDYLKEKHLPSMNLLYGLNNIWGIDVIRVKRVEDLYRAFTGAPSISTNQLADLYGIRYIVSVTSLEEDPRFKLIYARLEGLEGRRKDLLKENTIKLYKNRNSLPRTWLVKDYKVMDSSAILLTMTQKEFDPRREVLLQEIPLPLFSMGAKISGGEAEIISENNNRLGLRVKAAGNALLVLSDTYYPGWKAFVDGKETKIYRADYAFRAIPLNDGTHQVEFVYDPMSFKLGAGVTLLGILGCIGAEWVARRRKRSEFR
jgi:hypothetical protein